MKIIIVFSQILLVLDEMFENSLFTMCTLHDHIFHAAVHITEFCEKPERFLFLH